MIKSAKGNLISRGNPKILKAQMFPKYLWASKVDQVPLLSDYYSERQHVVQIPIISMWCSNI